MTLFDEDFSIVQVPTFSRLVDYAELWAILPGSLEKMREMWLSMDQLAHLGRPPEPLRSAINMRPGPPGKSIAEIALSGVLMKSASSLGGTSTVQVRRDLRQAVVNPDVAGILLNVDSPGGTVSGTDALARDVKSATKSKPVWVLASGTMASAAYWIASQADRIIADGPTDLVGSIGTYQTLQDVSEAGEKMGVRTLVIATGALKGLGVPGSKITEEQAAHVQGLVNGMQESFDAAVQKGRGLTAKQMEAVRHGGVLKAPDALQAGLIDAIMPDTKVLGQFADSIRTGKMAARESVELESKEEACHVAGLPMKQRRLPMLART